MKHNYLQGDLNNQARVFNPKVVIQTEFAPPGYFLHLRARKDSGVKKTLGADRASERMGSLSKFSFYTMQKLVA